MVELPKYKKKKNVCMCSVVPMKIKTQESAIGNDFLCLRKEKGDGARDREKKSQYCIPTEHVRIGVADGSE